MSRGVIPGHHVKPWALCLGLFSALRAHRSGFVPVHSLVYGPIDKAVHALAVGFCVGLQIS